MGIIAALSLVLLINLSIAQPKSASMIFLDTLGNEITQMNGTESVFRVELLNQDFEKDNFTYNVSFWNEPGQANPNSPDTVVTGQYAGEDFFQAELYNGFPSFLSGDQIMVRFIDPLDGDTVKTRIGYGVATEVYAQIAFLDGPGGEAMHPTVKWDFSEGSLFLRYMDDQVGVRKRVLFTIDTIENEQMEMEIVAPGVWEISVPLNYSDSAVKDNGFLEIEKDAVITAEVQSHRNNVNTETLDGGIAKISIQVEYTTSNVFRRPAIIPYGDINGFFDILGRKSTRNKPLLIKWEKTL